MTPSQPPQGGAYGSVPTLTEVVDVGAPATAPEAPVPGPTAAELSAASRPVASPLDEAAIAERVLAEVQAQLDRMLEVRLREALAPALVRTADALVRDARREIVAVLREAVDRAIQDARGPH